MRLGSYTLTQPSSREILSDRTRSSSPASRLKRDRICRLSLVLGHDVYVPLRRSAIQMPYESRDLIPECLSKVMVPVSIPNPSLGPISSMIGLCGRFARSIISRRDSFTLRETALSGLEERSTVVGFVLLPTRGVNWPLGLTIARTYNRLHLTAVVFAVRQLYYSHDYSGVFTNV